MRVAGRMAKDERDLVGKHVVQGRDAGVTGVDKGHGIGGNLRRPS